MPLSKLKRVDCLAEFAAMEQDLTCNIPDLAHTLNKIQDPIDQMQKAFVAAELVRKHTKQKDLAMPLWCIARAMVEQFAMEMHEVCDFMSNEREEMSFLILDKDRQLAQMEVQCLIRDNPSTDMPVQDPNQLSFSWDY